MINKEEFKSYLDELFPNAHCELFYNDAFTLLIAVMLSAQTTDASVNKVTPTLFEKYPTCYDLAEAKLSDVENIIRTIGLYKNKAVNVINTAKIISEKYKGVVPNTIEELTELPGVGRKTASVVQAEGFKIPSFPVDTHIKRISDRLGFSKTTESVFDTEMKLRKKFPKDEWIKLHHQILFFGRYFCTAKKPNCTQCKIQNQCKFYKSNSDK